MGANSSHDGSNPYGTADGKRRPLGSEYILPPNKKGGKRHGGGKPSPPSQPKALETTHNSVTLSWQPPRHNGTVIAYTVEMATPRDPKAWTVLTRSCQTSRYLAKGLHAAQEYVFRVRAENIHGVSKGSRPSQAVVTNMYETVAEQVYAPSLGLRATSCAVRCSATFPPTSATEGGGEGGNVRLRAASRRRHSVTLHLEGAVTSILNHTDMEVNVAGGQEVKVATPQEGEDRVDGEATLTRRGEVVGIVRGGGERRTFSRSPRNGTLHREAAARSSLPLGSRKRSLPILLPGTKTHSLVKLRDSHTMPNIKAKSEVSASSSLDSLKRRMGGLDLSGEGDCQRLSVRRSQTGSDICSNYSSGSSCCKEDVDVTDSRSCCSCTCSYGRVETASLPSGEEDAQQKVPVVKDGKCERCGGGRRRWRRQDGDRSGQCPAGGESCSASQRNSQATDDSEPVSEDSGNPWERHEEFSDVIHSVTAVRAEDLKMALYARSLPEGPVSGPGPWALAGGDLQVPDLSDSGHHVGHDMDFRALRSMLHSDDIIVRPTKSLPDVGGGLKVNGGPRNGLAALATNNTTTNNNNNNNNKLTTIMDLEEEEESVRITTL